VECGLPAILHLRTTRSREQDEHYELTNLCTQWGILRNLISFHFANIGFISFFEISKYVHVFEMHINI